MQTRFLIIGQGLCGSWLSYFLEQAGEDFIVLDAGEKQTSSRIASGVINPVTGRKLNKTWLAETLLPFAFEHYSAIGNQLQIPVIRETGIRNFFPTPQMQEAYIKCVTEEPHFVAPWSEGTEWKEYFNFDFGVGNIRPAYWIRLRSMLDHWQQHLKNNRRFLEEKFVPDHLQYNDKSITYKNISAEYIIFCDGVAGQDNPFFNRLPFASNKGEALLVSIPGLPAENIYKKGITLVPWDEPGLFWVGSTYQLRFNDIQPTQAFREQTLTSLQHLVKLPFELVDHWAAVRPATVERRPFVGLHPGFPRVGILNGTGTKGCSLAPYFAHQLTEHLCLSKALIPQADIFRFQRTLLPDR